MDDELEQPGDDAPLEDDEREMLHQDLVDVQSLKELLGPKGIKGVVFYCPDCDEDHYLAWDLLAGNLRELLDAGESPIHEPAFQPDPDEYVSWDYARGFLDGYESYEQEELGDAVNRVILELRDRGWAPEQVKAFLAAADLDSPSGEAPDAGAAPSAEQPRAEPPSGEQPSGEPPSGEQPSGEQPSGEPPSGGTPPAT